MEQQRYKKWEELTTAEKETWLHSFPREYEKNDISESDQLIEECFANCGGEWDSLKSLMKQDNRFKLQRTVQDIDKHGNITERREFY